MNAVTAKQENEGETRLTVPGMGERLRSARMACNLDMAKLAARIHLTADVVDALEHDDYSEMPARVFVRGYVRNYARAVNLPVGSVLAQFNRQWPEEDYQGLLDKSPRLEADPHLRRRWPGVVIWLVVVGLMLMWWQGYLDRYFTRWQEGPETTPVAASSGQSSNRVADAPVAETVEAESPAFAASPPAAETVSETKPESEPEPEPTGVSSEVVVRFLGDSWVDIRDSRRKYKLIGIMKRGTERRLGGTPPYTVVLGNARAVELRVDGEPYDLARHIQRNVARFTLEP